MTNAIIIDDERHCVDRLAMLLEKNFSSDVNVIGKFSSFDEGLAGIRRLTPSTIFLDVKIDEHRTGFDLLAQLDRIDFEVIFTTAFEKYAVQAFRISAIDYLLKPVDVDDLAAAIQKLKEKQTLSQFAGRFDVLIHNLRDLQGSAKRICVPVLSGFVVLQVADIIRCESNINYTTLFMKDKQKLTVAKTLKEFEEMLVDYNFFRVHNSHLVNMIYIKSYNKGKGGFVTLADNSTVEVSSRRKEEFLKRLAAI